MAQKTMKGVTITGAGAPFEVVSDLEIPTPGEHQVLVKSIATAINPVDTYMQSYGLLINSFPIVLGCDSSGIVTQTGPESSIPVGAHVCGCTRLGFPGYGTFQEYFLMDDKFAIVLPEGFLSFEDAATVGVGCETSCIGLLQGIKLDREGGADGEEWVVIFGGAGSVGQFGVQIAKALGYKVLATAGKRSEGLVRELGADAVVDYKGSDEEQFQQIKKITGGNFFGVWDTQAKSEALGNKLVAEASTSKKRRCYATTDDWTEMKEDYPTHAVHRSKLGYKARPAEESGQPELQDELASYAILIKKLLEEEKIKPQAVELVQEKGFEAVAGAVQLQNKGVGGGKKVVVKLQDA